MVSYGGDLLRSSLSKSCSPSSVAIDARFERARNESVAGAIEGESIARGERHANGKRAMVLV